MSGCIACGRELHEECPNPPVANGDCCCAKTEETKATGAKKIFPDHRVKDEHSTGRKRAAEWYPIDPTAPCEWRLQANCGGGIYPIVGCLDGLQENLHHGPDKNTLNNHRKDECKDPNCELPLDWPNQVHKICSTCHNRWHAANDRNYDPTLPHSPIAVDEAKLFELTAKASYGTIQG